MLLFNTKTNVIFNLDHAVYIGANLYSAEHTIRVEFQTLHYDFVTICLCDNMQQAEQIVKNIYQYMTYGTGNMKLDPDEYLKDKFLDPNKNDFDYNDTDSIKTETGRTREEIRGNEK